MSNCTNHEFYFMDNGCMPLRNKSMTLMRFCGFPHHGYRFFAGAQNDALPSSSLRQQILHIRFGWRLTFPLLWRLTLPSLWRLFSNCHSEQGQACLVGKTGNGMVTRSEESITLMTSYRLPHYGSRSFTFVQDDVLWSSSSRQLAFVIAPGDTWPSAVRRSCWRT